MRSASKAAGGSPRWMARRVQNTWFTESDSPLAASSRASGRSSSGSQPDSLNVSRAAAAARSPAGSAMPDGISQPMVSGMNRCRQSMSTRSSASRTAASTTGGSRST